MSDFADDVARYIPAASYKVRLDDQGYVEGCRISHRRTDRGDWMHTATGRAFYPLDPQIEEIHIEDIAAALSKLCRYGGHCKRFYSVAEHCVLMARAASPSVAFEALMHDASEAYLSDVIRPVKSSLPEYRAIEERLEAVIARRFDLVYPIPAEVKRLDNAILADERDQAMAAPPQDWRLSEPPLGITLQFWAPDKAEFEFRAAFTQYGGHFC
ncbi:phosphohydrolase [Nitrobacteraceae bacterium UC4446_H13]